MADEGFQIQGTNLSYREWSEEYLGLHLQELFDSIDYQGTWDIEMAFMNASFPGFTVGFRVLVPFYLGLRLLFEITWTRADGLVVMTAYHAVDEIRQLIGGPPTAPRAHTSSNNVKNRRFL